MSSFQSSLNPMRYGQKIRIRDIYVIDGDSLEATLPTGERFDIRLHGIDAPELAQPLGNAAREQLEIMAGRSAVLYVRDVDDYGRIIAVVYSGQGHGGSLNLRMIRAGYAYNYTKFGVLEGGGEAQDQARRNSRGIWASDSRLEEPWLYRARVENEPKSHDVEPDRAQIENVRSSQSTPRRRQETEQKSPTPKSGKPTISDPSICIAIALAVILIFLLLSSVCQS